MNDIATWAYWKRVDATLARLSEMVQEAPSRNRSTSKHTRAPLPVTELLFTRKKPSLTDLFTAIRVLGLLRSQRQYPAVWAHEHGCKDVPTGSFKLLFPGTWPHKYLNSVSCPAEFLRIVDLKPPVLAISRVCSTALVHYATCGPQKHQISIRKYDDQ